jgi:signal transduction histidine kinase
MSERAWRAAGWTLCGLSWGLCLAAVVVLVWNRLPWFPDYSLNIVTFLVNAALFGPVVALMLPRRRHPVVLVVAATALGGGACALMTSVLMLEDGPNGGFAGLLVHLNGWVWAPGMFATIAVMPWLVTEHRLGGAARVMVALGLAGIGLTIVTLATAQQQGAPANPISVEAGWWRSLVTDIGIWPGRLCFAIGMVASLYLLDRWLRGPEAERHGLGWLAIGQTLLTISFLPVFFPQLLIDAPDLANVLAFGLLGAQAFLPAALLVVVLRQRLWGVDAAVSRGLVGGLLSAAVVALYLGLVWIGRQALPWPAELSGVLAVGILAIAMQPLRSLVQQRVSDLVYGSSRTPGLLLRDLRTHLSGSPGFSSDLAVLVERLRSGLRLGLVELRSTEGHAPVRATSGQAGSDVMVVPLVVDGRGIGSLRVAPRAGERLDQHTAETIEQLSGLVVVSLRLAQVNGDLESARERLVEVRHEERRLLRRELHDELGPALAGIGLGLAAVQNSTPVDGTARELLAQLQVELADRTEDVRTMARALLPPALDEGRFEDALHVLVTRFDDTGLHVTSSVTGADALDARRQVALYHVAAEALVNAYRHAHASSCTIEVTVDTSGAATLAVSDDGRGFVAQAGKGVGLSSMRERALELGGTFEALPSTKGTTVRVRLP